MLFQLLYCKVLIGHCTAIPNSTSILAEDASASQRASAGIADTTCAIRTTDDWRSSPKRAPRLWISSPINIWRVSGGEDETIWLRRNECFLLLLPSASFLIPRMIVVDTWNLDSSGKRRLVHLDMYINPLSSLTLEERYGLFCYLSVSSYYSNLVSSSLCHCFHDIIVGFRILGSSLPDNFLQCQCLPYHAKNYSLLRHAPSPIFTICGTGWKIPTPALSDNTRWFIHMSYGIGLLAVLPPTKLWLRSQQ